VRSRSRSKLPDLGGLGECLYIEIILIKLDFITWELPFGDLPGLAGEDYELSTRDARVDWKSRGDAAAALD
jgi:hypothetical protein